MAKSLQELLTEARQRAMGGEAPQFESQTNTVQVNQEPIKKGLSLGGGGGGGLKLANKPTQVQQVTKLTIPANNPRIITTYDSHGRAKDIELNDKQYQFVETLLRGESCVLIGAAGTGKTTCTKAAVQALINQGVAPLQGTHKYLVSGLPAIIPCAYTRRATNNIRRAMSSDIAANTITIHKLLEYSPVYYEVTGDDGKVKKTMRFEPLRDMYNPLDSSIAVIMIDEASMLSTALHAEVQAALLDKKQVIFIYIGDIQQLPPVFGSAILGFKLLELPVIELTEVYRQAMDSPIIRLAHRILSGKMLMENEIKSPEWNIPGQLQFIPWTKRLSSEQALINVSNTLTQAYDAGKYDPNEDVILCPFVKEMSANKQINLSTIGLNRYIANHIARKNQWVTYEIIAGFKNFYYSVGDKVLYDKEDAVITAIEPNNSYVGKPFQAESPTLDYWGHDPFGHGAIKNADMDIDKILALAEQTISEDDKTIQASHIITVQVLDTGDYVQMNSLSQLNNLSHSYAMTIHKSQGSEWRRVFLVFHSSHACMIKRELLYTAVTRAREHLVVICEKDTFSKGILTQAIKGNTLEEKAEYFKGRLLDPN